MHPCFDRHAHGKYGRMHLPVAPRCNIRCGYCDRRHNCVNESRPGVTARVVSPQAACELALAALARMPNLSVAGIAGPGDPLANPAETLATIRLLREAAPQLLFCLSTNGLGLPGHASLLAASGVSHLTVTINAVDPDIGSRIYDGVTGPDGWLNGRKGAEYLLCHQLEGVRQAKSLGLTVKINMVIVPGINDGHAGVVARRLAELGADLMNCIPVMPVAGTSLAAVREPDQAMMAEVRERAGEWLPQMRHCTRCRADALGLLGEKGVLNDMLPHLCRQTERCKGSG